MKNLIKRAFCKSGLMLFLMTLSFVGNSQPVTGGQYSLSIGSATATANTIDVPLVVTVVNPSEGMRFTGFQTSINFNPSIINGGAITGEFVPSASVQFNTIGTVNSGTTGNVRISLTTLSNTGSSGVNLAQGASLNIGTIRIINTASWASGNANLWLQDLLASNKVRSGIQGVPYGVTNGAATSYFVNQPVSPAGLILSHTQAASYNLNVGQICATAGNAVVTNPECSGGTGSVVITLSPTPTVSSVSYTGAGSSTATLSSGAFSINGLAAGNYTVNVANTGCTTIPVSFTISVPTQATSSVSQTACDSFTWQTANGGNGQTYTQSGTYSYTDTSGACSVIRSLVLTIVPSSVNITNISTCDSYTWNGTTYTESGLYTGLTANCVTEQLNLTLGLTIASQPTNPTICKLLGATTSISVAVAGATPTYQWFTQTPTGTTWTALSNNANYAGVSGSTLNITRTSTTVPPVGTKYRLAVANACLPTGLISDTVTLQEQIVLSKAAVISAKSATNTTLSPAFTTCQGTSVNLSLAAGSIGNIQWQSSTNYDALNPTQATWTNFGAPVLQTALNAVNPILTTSSGVLTETTSFRVVASNGVCSSVNGAVIKIIVSLPAVAGNITGGDVTVCAYIASGTPLDINGNPLALPVTNSTTLTINDNTGTVTWQKSTNVITAATPTWANVTIGVVGNQLTVNNLTVDTWYRVLVKNGACPAISDAVKITVNKAAKAGATTATVNDGIVSTGVCTGGDITFTSAAYIGTSIQWEVSTTSTTTGFVPVDGATGNSFTMTNVTYPPLSKFYVRSVVINGNCTLARSTAKTITVNPLSVAGTVTGGGSLCSGSGATVKVAGNTGKIQWEYSTDGVNYLLAPYWKTVLTVPTFFNPSGTTEFTTAASTGIAATYVFSGLTTNVYFRAKITSGACSSVYTNAVQYVIESTAVAGTISAASSTLCPYTGTTLTLTGSVGAIQWQKSAISATTGLPGTFANISGQIGTTLSTGNLTVSTAFQAVVTIGSCSPTVIASYVVVNVVAKPIIKTITSNVTSPAGGATTQLCIDNPQKVLTIGAGYTGNIQWQTSTSSTTTGFTDIVGETGVTYTVSNPAVGVNYYRASFTNSCGVVGYSPAVTIYYKDCGARTIETEEPAVKVEKPFAVVAYPNPYSESFNLSLTTSSEEKVGIMVYDMTGKLIDQREVRVSETSELHVGDRYPSGIYTVIVTQGEEIKTLRVVKR